MPRQHVENTKEFWSEKEAKRANKHANKRMIYWPPFWNKVYGKSETRKATNPVSHLHSTPVGRHRQHDWPEQAVWIGIGPLWLEEDCSRHTSEKADDWSVTWSLIQITWIGNQNYFKIIPNSTIIQINITLNTVRFSIALMKSVASNRTWGLFLKSPETLRAYFGCHIPLYIFATPKF